VILARWSAGGRKFASKIFKKKKSRTGHLGLTAAVAESLKSQHRHRQQLMSPLSWSIYLLFERQQHALEPKAAFFLSVWQAWMTAHRSVEAGLARAQSAPCAMHHLANHAGESWP
jgi:hypothetical protein